MSYSVSIHVAALVHHRIGVWAGALLLASAASLVGCGDTTSEGGAGPGGGGAAAGGSPDHGGSGGGPAFTGGPGQPANPGSDYPPGPYGREHDDTMPNIEFYGYPNGTVHLAPELIRLADFYNPTGDGVYDEDSPYGAGTPKPKGLLITSSAVWCEPCQLEAGQVLPAKYEELSVLGGQFFGALVQSANYGVATFADLDYWTEHYEIPYPFALDPTDSLDMAVFQYGAFPRNMVIDTTTMKIREVVIGVPDDFFWSRFENFLNGSE